jgi:hypothetical protein
MYVELGERASRELFDDSMAMALAKMFVAGQREFA